MKKLLYILFFAHFAFIFYLFFEYFPDSVSPKAKDSIRLATWNVSNFGWNGNYSTARRDSIIARINELDSDIICLQEVVLSYDTTKINSLGYVVKQLGTPYYAYCHLRSDQFDDCHHFGDIILSKFPIIHTDSIVLGNGSRKYYTMKILIGIDTLSVTNVHLKSNVIDHKEIETISLASMYRKYKENAAIRASDISAIIKKVKDRSNSIVAGDFNDLFISETYKIANRSFIDAYAMLGTGPSATFNKGFLKLRIDYIFYRSNIDGKCVEVANFNNSDHRPLIMDFMIRSGRK